jgi:hypothetical protein
MICSNEPLVMAFLLFEKENKASILKKTRANGNALNV